MPPTPRQPLGAARLVPADQLPPKPHTTELPDIEAGHEAVPVDYDRLVYPGEVLKGSVTLAVLLEGDEKESYFGSSLTAIVQDHEDYADVKERIITVNADLVVSEVLETMDKINAVDNAGNEGEDADNQHADQTE